MRSRNGQNPRLAAVFIALSLVAGVARSDQNIAVTNVSGTLANGQTLTITGIGFGIKAPAAPLLWDDFEGHTAGEGVVAPVVGSYTRTGDTVYSQMDPYTGNMCAFSPVRGSSAEPGLISNWIPDVELDGFASMKFKIISTAGDITPHNIKLIRLNASDPDPTHGYPNYNIGKDRGFLNFSSIVNHGLLPGQVYAGGFSELPNPTGWNSVSIWDHLGTPDMANGFVGREINGSQYDRADIVSLISGEPNLAGLRSAYFCGYISHDGFDVDLYLDDLYADTTLARVLIIGTDGGNHEMQIPVAWTSDSIQVTARPGRFAAGSQVQLIVYDSENNASNPFTLTVSDDGSDPGPPGAPGQPVKQ